MVRAFFVVLLQTDDEAASEGLFAVRLVWLLLLLVLVLGEAALFFAAAFARKPDS